MHLTEAEQEVIRLLKHSGGVLDSHVEDVSRTGVFGELIPGRTIFKRLAKRGLVFLTEEAPIELAPGEWFDPTPFWCLDYEVCSNLGVL